MPVPRPSAIRCLRKNRAIRGMPAPGALHLRDSCRSPLVNTGFWQGGVARAGLSAGRDVDPREFDGEPNSVPLLELQGELYEEKGEIESAIQH